MPNKYNVQAKRQALDDFARRRSWDAFRDAFMLLLDETDDTGKSHAIKTKSRGKGNTKHTTLAQAVVECRNYHTTHITLLHSLCDIHSYPPPPDLIRLVATSCPRALTIHGRGLNRNRNTALTPLHLAIDQSAPLGTIKAIVEAAGDDLREKLLTMSGCSQSNAPLLSAVRNNNIDDETIKYLVDQDVSGKSLLLLHPCRSKRRHCPLKYVASRECEFVGQGLDNHGDLLRFMILRTYRAKFRERYPGYARRQSESKAAIDIDDDTCLLQATIYCYQLFGSCKMASSVLSYIIRHRLYQSERLISNKDDAGNLTLHIACLSDTPKFDQILKLGDRESDYGLSSDDCTLMEYLVRANPSPSTAPYLSPNRDGDIPLHCAMKSGTKWSQLQLLIDACPSSLKFSTAKGELPLHLAIKCNMHSTYIMRLWEQYSEAASLADKSSGLFPFQMIASSWKKQQSTREGKKQKKDKECLHADDAWDATSLSFFMLRECPFLLSSTLVSSGR